MAQQRYPWIVYSKLERGTGQGDTSSPATWVVFFDIVLRALEMEDTAPFLTVDLSGRSTPVPDCSFMDDLMSLTSSLAGLQRKADMMVAVSCILGLTIARKKLRVFSMDWSLNAHQTRSLEPEVILIHDMKGEHHKWAVRLNVSE